MQQRDQNASLCPTIQRWISKISQFVADYIYASVFVHSSAMDPKSGHHNLWPKLNAWNQENVQQIRSKLILSL